MKTGLHVISSGQQSKESLIAIASEIHDEVEAIHIREKTWTAKEMLSVIDLLLEEGIPANKIILNDRVDLCYMKKLGGVQLAHHSVDVSLVKKWFPQMEVGCSVHSIQDAKHSYQKGADYLLYGNIFKTASKPGKPGVGLISLKSIVQSVPIPVLAIGGIQPDHVQDVLRTGAKGVAVLSGIYQAKSPSIAAKLFQEAIRKGVEQR
ncbi:thiamine phosphate synthase [Bacillus sp. 2205SS5-2]|uniref:thiamine phosphate synthase n=1 Tax=Bacillus sp. 2205SS5-2 TaxID=3109031 RepID=UPI003003B828